MPNLPGMVALIGTFKGRAVSKENSYVSLVTFGQM